jgi:hypothetical protein
MPGVFLSTAEDPMAKPNYKFDKRQRDLAKKKQQEQKLLRKRAKNEAKVDPDAPPPPTAGPVTDDASS